MVGEDVVVTVLDVKGDHVRLGVTAPPATAVHRRGSSEGQSHPAALSAPNNEVWMRLHRYRKPAVARAIAAVLPGPQQRHKTYIQSGEANVVVWCAGHILTPYMPEDYDPQYKRWEVADLPIIPSDWKLKVAARTKKNLYQTITNLRARPP